MRYLGSKTSLLDDIYMIVEEYAKDGVFCDPFGGIGTVGTFMKKKGCKVITGDILFCAHCFQTALIEHNGSFDFQKLTENLSIKSYEDIENYLNNLSVDKGWLIEEYSVKRKFFTENNAKKIQACYNCIQHWKSSKIINDFEYKILIASLIQSFDKIANTAGTYYAYLKNYYRKALRPFEYKVIQPNIGNDSCKSYYVDALQLVSMYEYDVLYLDPPYNERKYEHYYHLPENIAKGITPIPKGKSGIYSEDVISSSYNIKSEATEAFKLLIECAKAKCIIFHYTNNGLIKIEDAKEILSKYGSVEEFEFTCKKYSTNSSNERDKHHIMRVLK